MALDRPDRVCTALVLACAIGCGPEASQPNDDSWVLEGFSDREPGVEAIDVESWAFEPDGTVVVTRARGASSCGSEVELDEYRWTSAGTSTVELLDFDDETFHGFSYARVLFRIGSTCTNVDLIEVIDGEEHVRGHYARGEVCLEPDPPCPAGETCNSVGCRTVWCDDEPPGCAE